MAAAEGCPLSLLCWSDLNADTPCLNTWFSKEAIYLCVEQVPSFAAEYFYNDLQNSDLMTTKVA